MQPARTEAAAGRRGQPCHYKCKHRTQRAASIPLEGAADHGVSEVLYLRDPDGNGVELYRDRPPE